MQKQSKLIHRAGLIPAVDMAEELARLYFPPPNEFLFSQCNALT